MKQFLLKTFFLVSVACASIVATPLVTFADNGLVKFVTLAEGIIQALFPIMVAVAILTFGYNLVKYLTAKDQIDQSVHKTGLFNSMIGIFVIFVIVGLITILAHSLGIPSLGADITVSDSSGLEAGSGGIATFRHIALNISKFISARIIPILVACSLLFFFGNIIISISKSNVEEERTKLNAYLRWGILALFLLLTVFSIVGIFTGSLFGTSAVIPQFPTSDGG